MAGLVLLELLPGGILIFVTGFLHGGNPYAGSVSEEKLCISSTGNKYLELLLSIMQLPK